MSHLHRIVIAVGITALSYMTVGTAAADSLSLAGQWRFHRDEHNVGIHDRWYEAVLPAPTSGPTTMKLPGTTDEAKTGLPSPEKPSLESLYRDNVYAGPAWYDRDVDVPQAWSGKRVILVLERVHWVTQAWLDGKAVGTAEDSLIAPHTYDFGSRLTPGKHRITLRVDNTLKLHLGAASIFFPGTQANWNGIVGQLELHATDPVSLDDVQVYPDTDRKLAVVRVTIANMTGKPVSGVMTLSAADRRHGEKITLPTMSFTATSASSQVTAELPMGEKVQLWDEFSPALYDLTVSIEAKADGANSADRRSVTFGMRKFTTRGTQFTMNGRPILLRGTLECAIFPLTGYPPCDVPAWQRIFRIMKSYGLNFVRFHSWCPPDAAFTAADVEGIMIQAEAPLANVIDAKVPKRDAFMEQEVKRMVRTYGNHPSFCMMTLGNEYGQSDNVLTRWIDMLIREDARHLYTSPSSGQMTTNRQYTERDAVGIRGPGTDCDRHELLRIMDGRPMIGHEIGQFGFYPNFDEIRKYTGVMKAKNFEIVRDDLTAKGMLDLAPRFFQAAGYQSALLYKAEIEQLRRTSGYPGFSLLDLHDYPGQGTAIVGILDPFWDSKGFVAPEVHRQYCGPTSLLLRMPKLTYTTGETFEATAEISHFGPRDLVDAKPEWSIRDQKGRDVAAGSLATLRMPTGKLTSLGTIRVPLANVPAPSKLTVRVGIAGTKFANQWEMWVYPPSDPASAPADVVVSKAWDDATRAALADGKKVLLLPAGKLRNLRAGGFTTLFWSPVMFCNQRPNTMSILCDPKHPAFAEFPTEFYTNWQWWDLLTGSATLNLNDTPAPYRPVVQVIDNFARNNKLAAVFEARVGRGRLLVCTLNLSGDLSKKPAAGQFLRSLYAYMASDRFRPSQELTFSAVDKVLAPSNSMLVRLGAKLIDFDSEQRDGEPSLAANAIDGDPSTFWHTRWSPHHAAPPHYLVIDIGREVTIQGVNYVPRQDMGNGRISYCEVFCGNDPKAWSEPTAKITWRTTKDRQTYGFATPVKARYVKLLIPKAGLAAVAEFDIITDDAK
jgi:hypothetical protein